MISSFNVRFCTSNKCIVNIFFVSNFVSVMEEKYGTRMIRENRLGRFENNTRKRDYTIQFTCPELTCLCPLSGFPDFAVINIEYQPDKYCVELKSLKLYINGFRDQSIFHEDVANKILDDLVELLQPKYMKVLADFNQRGNIHTQVTAIHGRKNEDA